MLLGWMVASALAAPTAPMVGVHAQATINGSDDSTLQGAGGGVSAGLRFVGPLWGELTLDAGWSAEHGVRVAPMFQLRTYLTKRDDIFRDGRRRMGAVALVVGAGADLLPTPQPLLHAGLGGDVFVGDHYAVRIEGGVLTHAFADVGGRFAVGFVWSPRKRPEPPPLPVETPRRWEGYPVCDWINEEEAIAYIAAVQGSGAGPSGVEDEVEAGADAPTMQGLVLVGAPGDELLTADDVVIPFDDDGVVALPGSSRQALRVRGGGRLVTLGSVRASTGHARWTQVPAPKVQRIAFPQGSAVVTPAIREALAALVLNTAGWRWELHGSYSPEGHTDDNEALAAARGRAVAEALIALGLPAGQVILGEVDAPDEALSLADQRSVRMLPRPPGVSP